MGYDRSLRLRGQLGRSIKVLRDEDCRVSSDLVDPVFDLILLEFLDNLLTYLLIGIRRGCRPALFELDYVEAVLSLDQVTDLSRLESESSLFKFRDHLAVSEEIILAAFVL